MYLHFIIPSRPTRRLRRVTYAVLGVNGRGKSHIESLMAQKNVRVATLCDPDMNLLKERGATFKETYDKDVYLEQDLRRVMDDKDIDVVSIASPNHWHSLVRRVRMLM